MNPLHRNLFVDILGDAIPIGISCVPIFRTHNLHVVTVLQQRTRQTKGVTLRAGVESRGGKKWVMCSMRM